MALLVSAILVALSGESPIVAFEALLRGAFGTSLAINTTLNYAVPIILLGLGWIVCFSGGRISLGFEGQAVIGGVCAAAVALHFAQLPTPILLPVVLFCAILGGGLWASIAALLLAKRGANEVISTLMLNFVAISILAWLVRGPLQQKPGTFPYSPPLPDSARWPALGTAFPLSWDLPFALLLACLVLLVQRRTHLGLQLRLTGANSQAAEASGISVMKIAVLGFVISGAFAGLAGASLVLSATSFNLTDTFTAGLGFTGIVAALLARNNPIGVIPAAILLAGLSRGGNLMETQAGVPGSIVLVTQGLVILFVAASAWRGRLRSVIKLSSIPGLGRTSSIEETSHAGR
ncbi:ABC transporter permease [Mycolicibacterium murale]|uniref:ABC transporter permease n=1 Tax=Mycolicibacterium murale TaxID=182220 RepID=UPI00187663F6|nr:ABC transporter permease [Mycolicibacterium murale]MCV7180327.1 ABC transporter permease [Mycolicibacterium murale]